ncbi:hypothetical protein HDE_04488 [Halotydeus destructor]|nr:hypothetical protein HDE_04488 [Halotydeus destructor]
MLDNRLKGLSQQLVGITIVDLKVLYKTDMQNISFGFMTSSIFNCVFSVIWGVVFRTRFDRRYGIFAGLILCAIVIGAFPHLTNVMDFIGFMAMLGVAYSALGSLLSAWVIRIWTDRSGPYLQLLYFFMSLGYLVAPLMANPFLAPRTEDNLTDADNFVFYSKFSKIVLPHTATAILVLLAAMLLVVQICLNRSSMSPRDAITRSVHFDPEKKTGKIYKTTVVILAMMIACFNMAYTENTGYYGMTFLTNIGVDKTVAAYLMTGFFIAFAIGRVCGVFFAARCNPGTMLSVSLIIMALGNFIMLIFQTDGIAYLAVGFITAALGMSTIQGSLYAFLDRRVNVSNFISSILNFGASVGPIIYPMISGPLIDSQPLIFLYVSIGCAIFSFMSLTCIVIADITVRRC